MRYQCILMAPSPAFFIGSVWTRSMKVWTMFLYYQVLLSTTRAVNGLIKRLNLTRTDVGHWKKEAQKSIRDKLRQRPIERQAKNVIFFLGDGMSVPTVTSTRIFKGQLENLTFGEEADLSFDKFPYTGVSKVLIPCDSSNLCVTSSKYPGYIFNCRHTALTVSLETRHVLRIRYFQAQRLITVLSGSPRMSRRAIVSHKWLTLITSHQYWHGLR